MPHGLVRGQLTTWVQVCVDVNALSALCSQRMAATTNGLTVLKDGPVLMSVPEAASALGHSTSTANKAIAEGTWPVPTIMVGGRRKVSRYVLDELLAGKAPVES